MNIEYLEKLGFTGFIRISTLKTDVSLIPQKPGVYAVLRPDLKDIEFLPVGSGYSSSKRGNPNVSISELQQKWIDDTHVIYIGKAGGLNSKATLYSRLKQYFDFGKGKNAQHWGGRYIWQIKTIDDCLTAWKELPNDSPKRTESEMLKIFQDQYGKLPFANLRH